MTLSDDPWEWPEIAGDQLCKLAAIGDGGPESPLFQYVAVQKCLAMKSGIEAGDGFSVLAAIRHCGNAGLKMPLWLVHAFNRKYMAVVNFRALSWDDPASFGRPYPKGANRTARAKKRLLSVAVYNAVNDKLKRDPETPIDKSLFDEIGRPFAIGATLAGEFFYYQKQVMDTISPKGKNPAKNGKIAGLQRRRK